MSEEMEKAMIIKRGKVAAREINGARIAAQQAWNNWRNYETYKTPEGHVTSRVVLPTVQRLSREGVLHQIQVDSEHPEHKRLREIAEEADRRVMELEDDLEIYAAVAPQVARKAS